MKLMIALLRLMPSSENSSMSSSRDIFSRSFFGDQPSRARKFTNACGQETSVTIGGDAHHRAMDALR